jgi:hypothetical protein
MMTKEDAAVVKGMLARGDKQQWIAAWFGGIENSGRIADINTGKKFQDVKAAPDRLLPPPGPYASGQSVHRALAALQKVHKQIERVIKELEAMEESND